MSPEESDALDDDSSIEEPESNWLDDDRDYYSEEDWEEDEYFWTPSCAMDCEICGCHGNYPDCDGGYEPDFWDVDEDEDPNE